MEDLIEEMIAKGGFREYTREKFEKDRARLIARLCEKHGIEESALDSLIREHRYTHSAEDPEDDYMEIMEMGRAAGWVEDL